MKRRRLLIYTLPILFLSVSIAVMISGGFLKQPLGEDDRLLETIQQLETHVQKKEWAKAKMAINHAIKAWQKIANRIQFSVERESMFEISGTLARIRGGIEAEDDKGVITEIYLFYELWDSLGS